MKTKKATAVKGHNDVHCTRYSVIVIMNISVIVINTITDIFTNKANTITDIFINKANTVTDIFTNKISTVTDIYSPNAVEKSIVPPHSNILTILT